jgi:hypothetical protein
MKSIERTALGETRGPFAFPGVVGRVASTRPLLPGILLDRPAPSSEIVRPASGLHGP